MFSASGKNDGIFKRKNGMFFFTVYPEMIASVLQQEGYHFNSCKVTDEVHMRTLNFYQGIRFHSQKTVWFL